MIIVGVNDFISHDDSAPDLMRVNASIGQRQAEKLRALRASRDSARVDALMARLELGARGTENLLPVMVERVESRVTLGEISHCLRRVWGEQRETVVI
jgi:methylmalonyl-CoA mutase N-terminal domain/subunit